MAPVTAPEEAAMPGPVLRVRDLTVGFGAGDGGTRPVSSASFDVRRGRTLGLVGESGSGKSVMLRAILRVLPGRGAIEAGSIGFDGVDLAGAPERQLREIRGRDISMIFQDPSASLNPVLSVGSQLMEVLRVKAGVPRRETRDRAWDLLERVGLRAARERLGAYPHQLSGGMAQRVMIAIAIAARPKLLLADEPTTALDVRVQDQVLSLLGDLQREDAMSMIIVSHDIGVVAKAADDVAVMYGARILETGPVDAVLRRPRHPYTRALLESTPQLKANPEHRRLRAIAGQMPPLPTIAAGCPFRTRCPYARSECAGVDMHLAGGSHASACPFVDA